MREFITKKDIGLKPLELSEADEKRVDRVIEKALGLDASGLTTLRERIRENGGLIRAFVHPFYGSKSRMSERNERRALAYDFVEEGAIRHANSAADNRAAPMFLFEEEAFLEDARQRLQENISRVETSIFIIPTSAGAGYIDPHVSHQALSGSDWYAEATSEEKIMRQKSLEIRHGHLKNITEADPLRPYVEGSVRKAEQMLEAPLMAQSIQASNHLMTILLKGLGVKKIVVGGMYLRDDPEELVGCVGAIIKVAKEQGITVSLSKYHTDWTGENARGVQQSM